MKFYSYDKNYSLVNFSNSFLKKYKCKTHHKSIKKINDIIKNHDKIALFLFDGFGKSISEKHLAEKNFLRKNYLMTISSTFPPTTSAATNAFLTGLYPIESGWLGWTFYDKKSDLPVVGFRHTSYIYPYNEVDTDYSFLKNETILESISKNNPDVKVASLFPSDIRDSQNTYKDFDDMFDKADKFLKNNKKCFIYCYDENPDHILHEKGTNDIDVSFYANKISRKLEEFANNNKDTIIFIFADHSHTDVSPIYLEDYKDFLETVEGCFFIEPRCASFNVLDENKEEFIRLFNKYFSKYYILYTKDEFLKRKYFGIAKNSNKGEKLLGDYILVATGHKNFQWDKKLWPFKANHAGGLKEENLINIYCLNKKEESN